jgi:CheY-like chemotaxis protein
LQTELETAKKQFILFTGNLTNQITPGDFTMNGKNILVCDDDEIFLSFFKRVLKKDGFQAITASNGDDAIELLNNGPTIALAMIDLLMPVTSGWEVIEYMKKEDKLKNIPIIAITGLSPSPGDLKKVKTLCAAVVHKSGDFNIEELSSMVKELTGGIQ